MEILWWIIFGAAAGWIASLIMKTDNTQGWLFDIILGIVGSAVGGFIFGFIGQSGVTGFNFTSLLVAVIGSMVVIFIGRSLQK